MVREGTAAHGAMPARGSALEPAARPAARLSPWRADALLKGPLGLKSQPSIWLWPEWLTSLSTVSRLDQWWSAKVAPVFAIALCMTLRYGITPRATAASLGVIAWVGLCVGAYGHVINDLFDREVDRLAGKPNRMARFATWQAAAIAVLLLLLAFAPTLAGPAHWSRACSLLLGLECLLPTLYAMPPIRLKHRDVLGLLADAAGAHVVPCLFAITVIAHHAAVPASGRFLVPLLGLISVWAFALGLVGILVHQFEDRANDLHSGIRTFATHSSFGSMRIPISLLWLVELIAFTALGLLLTRWVAIAWALYAAVVALGLHFHWPHYRAWQRPATLVQWWQLSHPFYESYLPLVAALAVAFHHHALVPLPLLVAIVFAGSLARRAGELRALFTRLLTGSRLHLEAGGKARLLSRPAPLRVTRIAVEHCGDERWTIRLARPLPALEAGCAYMIRLDLRADCDRTVLFGVWQDHAPWEELGYAEIAGVGREWQTIWRKFTATADDRRGYFGLWLGGEAGSVELRACSVRLCRRGACRMTATCELVIIEHRARGVERNLRALAAAFFRDLRRAGPVASAMLGRDLRSQYRTSMFGILMPLLPALTTALWAMLFRQAHLINIGSMTLPYPFYVLSGMMLWAAFLEAIEAPIAGVRAEQGLLAKAAIPGEAIVLARLGEVLVHFIVNALLLAAAAALYRVPIHLATLLAPLVLLPLFLLGAAIGLLLAPVNLLYHDVQKALPIVTTFWFFLTPILFDVPATGWAALVIGRLNPVTPLLVTARELCFGHGLPLAPGLAAAITLSLLLLLVAVVFHRIAMPIVLDRANA